MQEEEDATPEFEMNIDPNYTPKTKDVLQEQGFNYLQKLGSQLRKNSEQTASSTGEGNDATGHTSYIKEA